MGTMCLKLLLIMCVSTLLYKCCVNYVCNYLLLDYFGGWIAFSVSITFIGIMTAFIGDFAQAFGCTIGLKDQVTAISFVALGTSLPGWCPKHAHLR